MYASVYLLPYEVYFKKTDLENSAPTFGHRVLSYIFFHIFFLSNLSHSSFRIGFQFYFSLYTCPCSMKLLKNFICPHELMVPTIF